MRGVRARWGIVVFAACLIVTGAARAWKVTTSNHNDIQLPRVEADPTLYVMDVVGPDAVFIDAVAPDDGVNVSQLNMSIRDPQLNKAIGAITIGVAVDRLGP